MLMNPNNTIMILLLNMPFKNHLPVTFTLMSRNARSHENGEFDKNFIKAFGEYGKFGETGAFGKIVPNVLTNANELARRALMKVANMANLAKPANLAK